jgi:hypothetical protein
MRRFTLITLIVLFVALSVAAWLQYRAGQRPVRYPGPGVSATAPATAGPSSP